MKIQWFGSLPVSAAWRHGLQFALLWLLVNPLGRAADSTAPVAGQPSTNSLPPPRLIIDKFIETIGGREVFLKHASQQVKGKFELPAQGLTGKLEVLAAKPAKMLVRVELGGVGEVLSGYDGTVGWSIDPAMGPKILKGKQLEQMKTEADVMAPLHESKDFKSMETLRVTTFEGQECYELKLVRLSGDELTEFYDRKSGLLAGMILTAETPMGSMTATNVVSDYKKFGDLMIGTKNVQKLLGFQQVMTVESVEFDKVPDSAFDLPSPIKALVEK